VTQRKASRKVDPRLRFLLEHLEGGDVTAGRRWQTGVSHVFQVQGNPIRQAVQLAFQPIIPNLQIRYVGQLAHRAERNSHPTDDDALAVV
jgi:hypothetical protein